MALSVFEEEAERPTASDLKGALGKAATLWSQLVSRVAQNHPPIVELWHFGGRHYGWSLRLKRGDRIVLYLIPQRGHFLAGLVLGEKALAVIKKQDLPPDILATVAGSPRYGEGTGVRLSVTTSSQVRAIEKMTAAKMAF